MMQVNSLTFKSNYTETDATGRKKKIIIGASAGALLVPLIPIIDGDGFKKTYKNRNIVKFTTGMAAIGGFLGLNMVLTDKYIKNSQTPQKNKTIRNSVLGAFTLPAMLFVDNWASTNNKKITKKWYPIAMLAGAATGVLTSSTNKNN